MAVEISELDQMQSEYKAAVEEWIAAIRHEETLASVNHTVADIDEWERADDAEEEARNKTKAAKRAYEDALREKFFHF
jgi:L-arabinose isomerase